MSDISTQPFYDPDSRFWELKRLESERRFDKLPITDEDWQAYQTFLEQEYVPAVRAKRGSEPTWHETEMPFRFALEFWDEGERDIAEIIKKVRRKFQNMGIGVWYNESATRNHNQNG